MTKQLISVLALLVVVVPSASGQDGFFLGPNTTGGQNPPNSWSAPASPQTTGSQNQTSWSTPQNSNRWGSASDWGVAGAVLGGALLNAAINQPRSQPSYSSGGQSYTPQRSYSSTPQRHYTTNGYNTYNNGGYQRGTTSYNYNYGTTRPSQSYTTSRPTTGYSQTWSQPSGFNGYSTTPNYGAGTYSSVPSAQYSYSSPVVAPVAPAPVTITVPKNQLAVNSPPTGPIQLEVPADQPGTCRYVIVSGESKYDYSMNPGQSQELSGDRSWQIHFDRGGDFGERSYKLLPGTYRFKQGEQGWELYHSPASGSAG